MRPFTRARSSIPVNGAETCGMVKAHKSGQMVLAMTAISFWIIKRVSGESFTVMVMSMWGTGKTTSQMARVPITTWTERITRETGSTISIMAKARSTGLTVPSTMVSTVMGRSMDGAVSNGKMAASLKAPSSTIAWRDTACTSGTMGGSMTVYGKII